MNPIKKEFLRGGRKNTRRTPNRAKIHSTDRRTKNKERLDEKKRF